MYCIPFTLTFLQDILFQFNAQHDCWHAKCTVSGERPVRQERSASGVMEKCIVHGSAQQFILNTHALHNAHLIRVVLPRELTMPIPYTLDRTAHHQELARQLRLTQDGRRTATAEKAADKRKAESSEKQNTTSKRQRTNENARQRVGITLADIESIIGQ